MTPNMMMVRRQLFILMLTVQFMYKMYYGVQVIFYILLLNICEASLQYGPYVARKKNRFMDRSCRILQRESFNKITFLVPLFTEL